MNVLSRDAAFNMDQALDELNLKKLVLDVKAETQTILQLLVEKEVVTREEVQKMREVVKNSPKYKLLYDYLNQAEQQAQYYKDNPQEHLKAVMNAKMNGKL